MRRGRLYALWLLPPVILAALFIWAIAGQIKYRTVRASVLRLYGSVQGMEEGERGQRSGPDGDRMIAAADSENAFLLPGEVWAGQEAAGAPGAEGTSGSGSQGAPKDAGDDWETGEITLLFAGDIYLSDHVLNAYDQAGGIAGVLDEGLRDEKPPRISLSRIRNFRSVTAARRRRINSLRSGFRPRALRCWSRWEWTS